jgi:hypothetical protein
VVRVVIELDGAHKYRVDRSPDGVHVVVEGAAGTFAAWRGETGAGTGAPPAAEAAASAQQPSAEPPVADPRPVRRSGRRPARPAAPNAGETAASVEGEEAPAPVARRAAGPPRLTVTYQDADIRDVIAAFAAFSGRTIIAGRDVSGTVTAEVKDQPWDVALRALLGAQGLAASEDRNGIIIVDSWRNLATTRSVEPMATQIISVNYAKASSLLPVVQTLLTRDCAGDGGTAAAGGAPAAGGGDVGGAAARLHRARRRHGRLGDEQAPHHRRAVAHGRDLRPAQGARRAHAAGGDPGEDRVRQPHPARGHRRLVRPRHRQPAVLPEARPAHRPDHGGAVRGRPGGGGRQRAQRPRQRRPGARALGAQPDLLGDDRALPAHLVHQRTAADVAGGRAERAEHRDAQQPDRPRSSSGSRSRSA